MSEPSTSDSLDDGRERRLKRAAVVAVSVVVVLYGVLIAGQILLPVVLILGGFVLYLGWRFVRAHERIAAATERIAAAQTATGASGETDESAATVSGPDSVFGERDTERDSTEE